MTQQAVVIGGSVAGLLAARVLADHFERVTVVERDELPDSAEPRTGVPQGRHIHLLTAGGANVVEVLFPGILDELKGNGAVALDPCRELKWFHHGIWKRPVASNIVMHSQSRPFLEQHVRRRLAQHPRVAFQRASASELRFDAAKNRVVGVRIEPRDGSANGDELSADLVVDATGRGSKTPQFLETIGIGKPPESTVGIDLAYASRLVHVPANPPTDWKALAVYAKAPMSTRYAVIFPIEGNQWIVTLAGCLGDHPPDDETGFLEFARQLDRPDLFDAIQHAEPASPIATYRFPNQLRRHYERLNRFPDGLLVVGDALCSFNPLYGQGMSVCALEAQLLAELLRSESQRPNRSLAGLPRKFFQRARPIIDAPWMLATTSDFLYPATAGHRPFGTGFMGWYIVQLLELSGHDETIVTRFHEVLHFLKPPTVLFHPKVAWRALRHRSS